MPLFFGKLLANYSHYLILFSFTFNNRLCGKQIRIFDQKIYLLPFSWQIKKLHIPIPFRQQASTSFFRIMILFVHDALNPDHEARRVVGVDPSSSNREVQ